jgi:hypothetical protein
MADRRVADRRPLASVAIIGNDAVLAAAPATPVQLAHACLRRGYSMAVPASWGDELVASEALRRLASRARGPAVMCVCPFVRSRLLTPGPDLAPFLVSLVSPPVAAARYLRAVYADAGVHITYIGGCPGADDAAIDACLTPDAFLADLAEQNIALSEQPLVFDSIVPPDRRRWCSLPGGVPTAEVLWSDTDTRTLIEIDRDDVSTDLAQHIITHEHVLLDLAPSLGCACSGAVGSIPPRSARVAVTALEPPRALGPIIDPVVVVSLEVPVRADAASDGGVDGQAAAERGPSDVREPRASDSLGAQATPPPTGAELEITSELEAEIEASDADVVAECVVIAGESEPVDSRAAADNAAPTETTTMDEDVTHITAPPTAPEVAAPRADESVSASTADQPAPPPGEDDQLDVRRNTPSPNAVRHTPTSIPKVTASDGRALPRAYVAKRRTPAAGMPTVSDAGAPPAEQVGSPPPPPGDRPPDLRDASAASGNTNCDPAAVIPLPNAFHQDPARADSTGSAPLSALASSEPPAAHRAVTSASVPDAPARESPAPEPVGPPSPSSDQSAGPAGPPVESTPRPEHRGGGAAAVPDNNPSALVVLLVALLALGFFVLRSLN